ncbi:glycosyl hydrolase family 28-related protein [Dyella sp. BiH032]|uniref:glycosyl hydrolase family 28-related protein n=1 Tax=Dyella sp. BiH032 TaxID=3075430 RepID=UPI0028931EB8|nr:glycosyl hydrolase family 28-related protein [Dyella sp. BiH032]WNL45631.1 glycosyl hydrolase family 28-related protein [Dyella sp. BiH032]
MTVNTSTAQAQYTGNGVTHIFAIPFYFLVDTDIKISKKAAATGVVTVLVLNSDYTLTGAGNGAGGSATLVAAPASGDQVLIERNVAAVQQTAYPSNSVFPSASHEMALDRLTMLVQQLQVADGRTLTRGGLATSYDITPYGLTGIPTAVNPTDAVSLSQAQTIAAGAAGGIVPSLIVTYPGLAAAGGAGYVGFQLADTGSVARTAQTKMRDYVSLKDFGAVGNGTTDDTAAIQAAVNACVTSGKTLLVPAGKYRTTSVISVGGKLDMVGEGTSVDRGTGVPGTGSWFYLNHSGQGFFLVTTQQGGIFQKFGTYRSHPAPGVGWTPTVYDYDFFMSPAANEWTFKDMMLLNPYKGIKCSNRPTIDNVKMHAFVEGICIDDCRDTARLQNVHMWPFWSEDTNVTAYTLSNLKAYRFLRVDNPTMVGCFCIFANKGLSIENGATGTTYALRASCINFDGVVNGLVVDAAATGATMQVSNIIVQNKYDSVSVGAGVQIAGTNCQAIITGLSGYDFPQGIVRVDGTSNTVVVSSASFFNWDRASAGVPAVVCGAGNYCSVIDYSASNTFSTVAARFSDNVKTKHNDIITTSAVDVQAGMQHAGNIVLMSATRFLYLPGLVSGTAQNLPNGTRITVVNAQGSGGNVTVAPVSGVTLYRGGTSTNIVLSAGSAVTVLKTGDNAWIGL